VNIGLFGSFAFGQPGQESDIDFIVELEAPRFEWMAGLQIYLENVFKRKIGLIRKGNPANQGFEKRVSQDAIYV
ncbi:MAG: nucleotidyltransferase domain-containing protein, partial [Desulfobacterales bacterium]